MNDCRGVPDQFTDEELIAAFLHCWSGEESASTSWAINTLDDLVREYPERAWNTLWVLIERASTDEILSIIAAGPLEDLLCEHGSQFIAQVEKIACESTRFRRCLAGVWGWSRMSPEVYQRMRNAAGDEVL